MLVLYIGYLMQPFTQRKQALHDMICGTAVLALAPASRILLGVAIVFGLLIPTAGIVAAISIPAYQDYTVRARVSEALVAASPARDAVNAYIVEHNAVPKTLAEAGVEFPPTPRIQGITINPRDATLTLALAFSPLAGKTILLVPQRAEGNAIAWKCRPGTAPRKYLPATCRNN
jgi:Tfp pilus assembly major pilin PilA